MSNTDLRGRFVWHELLASDPAAAITFYTRLMPWKTEPSGMPDYTLWMSGKTRVGGLMPLPQGYDAGAPAQWMVYIGTPDVDAAAEMVGKLGGRVCKPAADIPNVGRFAVLADPAGATFAVFTPAASGDGAMPAAGAVGDFAWHELATTDLEGAVSFYTQLFGWSRGAAHDMGPMGLYQLFSHDGQDVGGMYKVRDNATPPGWLNYARVTDVDKAAAAVKAGGGRILNGPMEVPGGAWIVNLLDPQGGAIAVVESPVVAEKAAAAAQKASPEPAAAAEKSAGTQSAGRKSAARKSAARKSATGKSATRKSATKRNAGARTSVGKTAARKSASANSGRKTAAKRGKSAARGKSSARAKSSARGRSMSKTRSRVGTRGRRVAGKRGRR